MDAGAGEDSFYHHRQERGEKRGPIGIEVGAVISLQDFSTNVEIGDSVRVYAGTALPRVGEDQQTDKDVKGAVEEPGFVNPSFVSRNC